MSPCPACSHELRNPTVPCPGLEVTLCGGCGALVEVVLGPLSHLRVLSELDEKLHVSLPYLREARELRSHLAALARQEAQAGASSCQQQVPPPCSPPGALASSVACLALVALWASCGAGDGHGAAAPDRLGLILRMVMPPLLLMYVLGIGAWALHRAAASRRAARGPSVAVHLEPPDASLVAIGSEPADG